MFKFKQIFWACTALYFVNRAGLQLEFWNQYWFLRNYFNDLLFVPLVLPVMFIAFYKLGLRENAKPNNYELVFHVLLWTIVIEYIGPHYLAKGYSDPYDVLCYGLGGLICYCIYNYNFLSPSSRSAKGISSSN